ncbi:hypothetical protein EV360DRAFT_87692 [Lentinula raphanica]|nr:hypothetical protein EV360DRAFT_87692 [Lentinula raphanica]
MLARILLRMTVTCFCAQGLFSSLSPWVSMASPLPLHQSSSQIGNTVSAGSDSSSSEVQATSQALTTRTYGEFGLIRLTLSSCFIDGEDCIMALDHPLEFLYEPPGTWGFVFNKQVVVQYTRDLASVTQGPEFHEIEGRPYVEGRDRAHLKDLGYKVDDVQDTAVMLLTHSTNSYKLRHSGQMHPIRFGMRVLGGSAGWITAPSTSSSDHLYKWLLSTLKQEDTSSDSKPVEFLSKPPAIVFDKRIGYFLDSNDRPTSMITYNKEKYGELKDFGLKTKFVDGCMLMLPGERFLITFDQLVEAGLLTAEDITDSRKKLTRWLVAVG